MARGLQEMGRVLVNADCILEVHDARIAFSGRNEEFRKHVTGGRLPHILVLNKAVSTMNISSLSSLSRSLRR